MLTLYLSIRLGLCFVDRGFPDIYDQLIFMSAAYITDLIILVLPLHVELRVVGGRVLKVDFNVKILS